MPLHAQGSQILLERPFKVLSRRLRIPLDKPGHDSVVERASSDRNKPTLLIRTKIPCLPTLEYKAPQFKPYRSWRNCSEHCQAPRDASPALKIRTAEGHAVYVSSKRCGSGLGQCTPESDLHMRMADREAIAEREPARPAVSIAGQNNQKVFEAGFFRSR